MFTVETCANFFLVEELALMVNCACTIASCALGTW